MAKPLADAALDQLWRNARTRRSWTDEEVPEVLIRAVYDLQKWAPTSGNISPGRFLFVHSQEAKQRLDPLMAPGNREQTMNAPWTCIVAYDLDFPKFVPRLAPFIKDVGKAFVRCEGNRMAGDPERVARRSLSHHGGAGAGSRRRADERFRPGGNQQGILPE